MSHTCGPHLAIGVVPISQRRTISGFDFMRGILDGTLPAPPIYVAMHFTVIEVDPGRVRDCTTPSAPYMGALQ